MDVVVKAARRLDKKADRAQRRCLNAERGSCGAQQEQIIDEEGAAQGIQGIQGTVEFPVHLCIETHSARSLLVMPYHLSSYEYSTVHYYCITVFLTFYCTSTVP